MTWLLLNIPLMILFFALMVGIPMWLVRKHPDTRPTPAAVPAVRRMPATRAKNRIISGMFSSSQVMVSSTCRFRLTSSPCPTRL